ncbi:TetR/AcrR family transcriptional regulator [Mycolicibacterium sp. 050158]|uniref:TetR/AcrR family transcriptional regulator n=1 Tax=Mycolicibacterium sp. 050158 TaxID=3090602 RepID=UPI00299D332F|nr:WHG domain-containing protein [Mycolicibacterium sp. 050158]MDX1890258.1 WHG domain-containing protein [Mycolicibacterium sp. 050158]
MTVRAVAQQAAVSPTSVYNRFGDKEGLITALATRTLDGLAEVIDVGGDLEPVEQFRTSCRNYREFALRHPARYSLIFGPGSPLEDRSSDVAAAGRAVFAILVELIRAVKGSAPEQDSFEFAQVVWSALHGAVTIEHAKIAQVLDEDATFERMLDVLAGSLVDR